MAVIIVLRSGFLLHSMVCELVGVINPCLSGIDGSVCLSNLSPFVLLLLRFGIVSSCQLDAFHSSYWGWESSLLRWVFEGCLVWGGFRFGYDGFHFIGGPFLDAWVRGYQDYVVYQSGVVVPVVGCLDQRFVSREV